MTGNVKDIFISPGCTIMKALELINNASLRIALVVDEQERLLGTVTDGDVRRGLLMNVSLDQSVVEVMNKTPTTAPSDTPKQTLLTMMDEADILSIPLVDNERVTGIQTLHNAMVKPQYQNPVFLMAGGFGTRLRPLTDNCPKPLLKVGSKPILETVMDSFIKAGFCNFYISTHFLPEMIREHFGDGSKWGVSIRYIHEESPLGTGGALSLLPDDLPDLPVILMNGDVLTKIDFANLLKFHNKNQGCATMCVREYEYQVPFGVVESDGAVVTGMVEKPTKRFHINAGIYVIEPAIINTLKKNERIDMPTFLELHIDKKVLKFPFYEYWLDIGRMDDFKRAQIDIQTLNL